MESGILQIDKKLPVDPITLLYYLLMSEIVEVQRMETSKKPMYEGGPHIPGVSVVSYAAKSEMRSRYAKIREPGQKRYRRR